MGYALIIIAFILILLGLVWLDFRLGRKSLIINEEPIELVIRESRMQLLTTGDQFVECLTQDLFHAKKHIHMLFYIFRDDHIGQKMIDLLELKAKQGVKVRLMVDMFGCKISFRNKRKLKKAGVKLHLTPPLTFPYFFFKLNQRNHRKIVICDSNIAYFGGYNIGDEYLGRDPKFGRWRDLHIRMQGSGVQDLQKSFLNDWEDVCHKSFEDASFYPVLQPGTQKLIMFPTNGLFLEEQHLKHIEAAKHSITIATAYFIPSERLMKALIQATKRGVQIKIILPKKSDHPLVREAAFPFFDSLLRSGVQIYQYYRGFFHTKAILFDNDSAYLGTANFDKRSIFINLEQNSYIYDKDFIKLMAAEIDYDISISHQLTIEEYQNRGIYFRLKEKVASAVSDFL
ncbi:cardiolipin synthase [Alkalihalobacillus sp. 1P02AB]|uniref:cardiolipin synthase n=1 Tax=Alkalihalobacillus sp. 1P02AB TaxID=3132260 RepID=UPI0039A47D00